MKNSAAPKFSSAKSFAAAILFAAVALAFACGLAAVPVQAATKMSSKSITVGKTLTYKTSTYSKVKSSNSKVLKVTKKNGKWVVKAKKAGSYNKDIDEYSSKTAKLSLYKNGKLAEKVTVTVYVPSKLICVGKSAKYKTSTYSKVVSSNSKVLKVTKKNGKWVVKAKKAGVTTLKFYKKKKLLKKMNVVVEKASDIKADTSAETLKVGKSFTWGLYDVEYCQVKYSVSNSSILSIGEDGKFTAKKAGSATAIMKLTYGATTLKTYKKKVTTEKKTVKKTINVPIADLEEGYNQTYINKNNITMLENEGDNTLCYELKSGESILSDIKITGDSAELGNVNFSISINRKSYQVNGGSFYNPVDKTTYIYIKTNGIGTATLTAENNAYKYQITIHVLGLSNKADGTLYTGWVDDEGNILNPDKTGADTVEFAAYLVYKGRYAKTTAEMQTAAKVNCTPIKKFLNSTSWDDVSDLHKVTLIREYLLDDLEYDLDATTIGWPSVLYGKVGVCSDYSDAVSVLGKLLGLDVIQISNSKHEWPLFKIDGKWYDADLMKGMSYKMNAAYYADGEEINASVIVRSTKMVDGLLEITTSTPNRVYYYGEWNKYITNKSELQIQV